MNKFNYNRLVIRYSYLNCMIILLTSLSPILAQSSSNYDLSLSVVNGGGGTSSGGIYVVSGTIAQPAAGILSEGERILAGGFWYNRGCQINLSDLVNLAARWLAEGPEIDADFDKSGEVDLIDFRYLATNWLQYCPNNWPW